MFSYRLLFLFIFVFAFLVSPEKGSSVNVKHMIDDIPENLYFHVYRNDTKIGFHSVKFSKEKNEILNAEINIVFNVKFLGINVYKYKHLNNEKWKFSNNNKNMSELKLISLRTKTSINNEITSCNKKNELHENEKNIFPTSYWNPNFFLKKDSFSLEMFNTQDCSFFELKVKKLANEKIYDKSLIASRYKLFGETNQGNILDIDIWYSKKGKWVKMIFLKDGSEIEYILDEYHEK